MAVPAGAPFSKYMDENILTPLISRLDFMLDEKHFGTLAEPSHSTSTDDEDFSKIKEMMSQVQDQEQELFGKIVKEEQPLVRCFDQVEKYIDNIFESIAAGSPQASEVRIRLDTLKKQVVGLRDAILEAHKRSEEFGGGGGVGGEDPVPMKATDRIRAIRDGEGMAHLRRAVSAMKEPLKSCLLSLAAFPEGAVIKKRLLIHWWIGEDLVPDVGEGEVRFQKLVDMNFVQAIHRARSDCDKVHRCTVHPWIHRTIAAVGNSTAFMEVDPDDISSNDYQRTPRACLRDGKATLPGSGLQFHPKVSTIYNIDQKYVKLSADWFAKKACLRTLQLGQWRVSQEGKEADDANKFHVELIHDEHLWGIAACRALRYLSLRGISRIKAIPDAVGNLSELLVLDLRACHDLQVLTKETTKLQKLQYLDVSECYLLVEMPKGFDKMSKLEVLMGFVMASPSRKKACRLSELVNLKNLHKLSICIGKNVMRREDDADKKVTKR